MNSSTQHYSSLSKLLHWIIAFIIIIMLSLSFFIEDLPNDQRATTFMLHKSFGLSVLVLMLLRFIWLEVKGKPSLPDSVPPWQAFLSRAVHYSLYILLILMPLTGWLMSVAAGKTPVFFNMFYVPFPGIGADKALAGLMNGLHKTLAWVLIAFVILHISAALKHHFIDKDGVLNRMLPTGKRLKPGL